MAKITKLEAELGVWKNIGDDVVLFDCQLEPLNLNITLPPGLLSLLEGGSIPLPFPAKRGNDHLNKELEAL
ncbi:hypothetical protein SUGI_0072270 [Cryptomeria japonica]|nr:hypothetical protein SUGI_0072270 [Cryptomeria japonica]